ncbi:Hsp20/alpha crystallin family protein [Dactylosporangium sp. CA-233914]|uniref:Hsp20/alpha crystallin family protein n=1 Tax=Dactylosporangium sp. CA-233914 TaxID=3239934 RepID=UPI003D8C4150
MTLLVTRPRRPLAMFPALGLPVTSGAPVDVEETGDAFRIELDLPGVATDDVQIELCDNDIRVFGTFGERPREGTLRHHARRQGEFDYIVELPGGVEADGVTADLDGGVLTIVAPKAHGAQARRIPVGRTIEGGTSTAAGPGKAKSPGAAQGPGASGAEGPVVPDTAEGKVPLAPDTPAAQAKQMREGRSRPGPASQQTGSTGVGSTGQVGRSSTP